MKAIKTITVRLPGETFEKLCKLAENSEELPSETARQLLRGCLNYLVWEEDGEDSTTEAIMELLEELHQGMDHK